MGGFGWHNPFPFQFGGGPTRTESMYLAMRSVMGGEDGRALGPVGGLEDEWRRARAKTFAALDATQEIAIRQFWPSTATVHLTAWEARTGIDLEPNDAARRAALVAWTREKVRADCPSLEARLAAMSPYFSLYVTPWEETMASQLGYWLNPPEYGGGLQWPGYSDGYVLRAVWDHEASGVAYPPEPLLGQLKRFLNDTLPSWVDWRIQQAPSLPFYLDGGDDGMSLLDARSIGPVP